MTVGLRLRSFKSISSIKRFPVYPAGLWLILTLSLVCQAAVDLWVQTLIHSLVLVLAILFLIRFNIVAFILTRKTSFACWLLVLTCLGLSTLKSGAPSKSLQELWNWFDYCLVFLLSSQLSQDDTRSLGKMLLLSLLFILLWAGKQYLISHQSIRAGLLNPNSFASFLLMPLFLMLEQMDWRKPAVNQWLMSLCFILAVTLFILCRSLGAWVALGAGLSYLAFRLMAIRSQKLGATFILLTGCLLLLISKGLLGWDAYRMVWWKVAIRMAALHPFIGLGLNTFELGVPHPSGVHLFSLYVHNCYLQWLAESGLFGVGSILLLSLNSLFIQKNPYRFAAGGAILLHSLVDFSMILPAIALCFWTLLGTARRHPVAMSAQPLFRRPAVLATLLACLALGSINIQHFRSNQAYARALYDAEKGDLEKTREMAQYSIHLDPQPADSYALLARVSSEQGMQRHSRAEIDQALSYSLSALQREPARPALWANAIHLYGILGCSDCQTTLRNDFYAKYPYFRQDQQIQTLL